jgi:hypothetical protein
MRNRNWQSWLTVLLLLAGLCFATWGQETERPRAIATEEISLDTNAPPPFDPETPLPKTLEEFWFYGIALITPLVVFGFGKIPQLPRPVLPMLGPLVGIILGFVLEKAGAMNIPWWHGGLAGAFATTLREMVNQLVTKQLKPLELSKTRAKPVDHAVAVNETKPENPTRPEARIIQKEDQIHKQS